MRPVLKALLAPRAPLARWPCWCDRSCGRATGPLAPWATTIPGPAGAVGPAMARPAPGPPGPVGPAGGSGTVTTVFGVGLNQTHSILATNGNNWCWCWRRGGSGRVGAAGTYRVAALAGRRRASDRIPIADPRQAKPPWVNVFAAGQLTYGTDERHPVSGPSDGR